MRNNQVATLVLSSVLFLIGFGCSAKANTEIELLVATAAPHILVVSFIDDYDSASLPTDPLTSDFIVCPTLNYSKNKQMEVLYKGKERGNKRFFLEVYLGISLLLKEIKNDMINTRETGGIHDGLVQY